MIDLSIEVDGLKFDNPFVIGSGPPGSNTIRARRVRRAVPTTLLLLLTACAGPETGATRGWSEARVGDRVDLRFDRQGLAELKRMFTLSA